MIKKKKLPATRNYTVLSPKWVCDEHKEWCETVGVDVFFFKSKEWFGCKILQTIQNDQEPVYYDIINLRIWADFYVNRKPEKLAQFAYNTLKKINTS